MISVAEVHVGMAALEKKRFITRREAAEGVRGGIANKVRFCLDDSSAEAALRNFVDERFSDEKFREFDGIDGKVAQAKTANPARNGAVLAGGRLEMCLCHDSRIYDIEDGGHIGKSRRF